eukprot:CAMPEP_0184855786 /NCGR_PEP_ID=MMETSP0580-20130426/931_1 /TAXON_ID=1118495 /ORGANISM="Dactyliosolen fragilissimus" /LENGTH=287 /DNA_ID=CAMNT_0027350395 /DNA_START=63 /DNA_END=926 /DNA_ORIENTATION=-
MKNTTKNDNDSETSGLLMKQNGARKAFEGYDTEASRLYHDSRTNKESDETHQTGGSALKPIIFGGLDGILTSFAIVAGSAGGSLSPKVILILGFSNIFADALSMGVGEFLSSKAENEWILSERRREEWELENYPEGEIREMIELYESRGMTTADARVIVETMSKYKDFFVDVMMIEELGLQVPEDDHEVESMKEGVVMFFSFAGFGSLPLLGYVLIPLSFPDLDSDVLFASACVVTGVVLFIMGCVKSIFSAAKWYWCGLETLLLGGACASLAFSIGQFVDGMKINA